MKKIYIVLLLFSILCNTGCSDFLDVKPVGQLIPSKVEDLENLLNNTRSIDYFFIDNNRGSFYSFLGDNVRISENQSEHLYVRTHPNVDRFAAYTFNPPYSDPAKMHYTWEWGVYRSTAIFNTVIDEVKGLNAEDSDLGKLITAQAKAGRAWSYMVGGLGYGPVFNSNSPSDRKVMPYRKASSPVVANPELSTLKEILDLAEQDLIEARVDAPVNVGNPTRANKTAVDALLSQLYMYKRDWENMRKYAESAWIMALETKGGVDNLIYNYNEFDYRPDPEASPSEGTDVEVGLELLGQDNLINQTNNREFLFYRPAATSYSYYPSDEFLELFDEDSDQRHRLFVLKGLGYSKQVAGVIYDDGVQEFYYRDMKMERNQGLTYPELLLMKAEANARTNNLSTALSDLNLLRKYRYSESSVNLPNGNTMTQDQLLEEILKERRRELPLATYQRVFDLKRYSLDTGKAWSKDKITHYIGDKEYTAPINEEYFTLDISNNILDLNPEWGIPLWTGTYTPIAKK